MEINQQQRSARSRAVGDGLLERVVAMLGVDVEQARRVAPQIQKVAEALAAAAETFAHRMRS